MSTISVKAHLCWHSKCNDSIRSNTCVSFNLNSSCNSSNSAQEQGSAQASPLSGLSDCSTQVPVQITNYWWCRLDWCEGAYLYSRVTEEVLSQNRQHTGQKEHCQATEFSWQLSLCPAWILSEIASCWHGLGATTSRHPLPPVVLPTNSWGQWCSVWI